MPGQPLGAATDTPRYDLQKTHKRKPGSHGRTSLMKLRRHAAIWIIAIVVCCGAQRARAGIPFVASSTVKFATVQEGQAVLGAADSFVKHMSPLDRELRLRSEKKVTQDEYLAHARAQVIPWTDAEVKTLTGVIEGMRDKLSWLKCSLPQTILLVQTTKLLEGGAPHTRGNAIVIPQGSFNGPVQNTEHILFHELFHLISKANPDKRASLYRIIGFETTPEITLPTSLGPRDVTNPDAPAHDVVIEVKYKGRKVWATPVLLSTVDRYDKSDDRPFPVGYLDFKLMQVTKKGGRWIAKKVDGGPVLMDQTGVSQFFEQIGRNTPYIIHPDEILAENFALIATGQRNLPSPEIASKLREQLSK